MKNCRNCSKAAWYKHPNGRRSFGNWARCTAEIDTSLIPLSAGDMIRDAKKIRAVAEHSDTPINCPQWVKL